MKCDLCKGEMFGQGILCENCTDAVRRLVKIVRAQQDGEAAAMAAAAQSTRAIR
jgi:hypothetical protein